MISNISNSEHERFCLNLKATIKKLDEIEIPIEEAIQLRSDELKCNLKELQRLYFSYKKRSSELRKILHEYEERLKLTRTSLRKTQSWYKFTYPKLSAHFLKTSIDKFIFKKYSA